MFCVKVLVICLIISSTNAVCVKDGIRFQQGQSISVPGQCMKITCEDAATNRQSGIICAYVQPRPGCRWSSTNYALPYPQCCPVEIC